MKRALLALALLVAAPAWGHEIACPAGGVDGQRVDAGTTTDRDGEIPSPGFRQDAFWLCCNNAGGACTDKNLQGAASAYLFSLENVAGCTAVDVTVGFRNDASGVNHTVGTLSLGTTSLVVARPAQRFATATVNAAAGCASGADVRVDALYERQTAP